MIKVRYMRDNLVLFTPKEGEQMEEIIKLNNKWFTSLFEDIEPWSESLVVGHRLAWARCYDIPIPLWNRDCLSKVVGEAAELVSIDEATEQWENLECARIQIRVLNSRKVEVSKGFRINGQIYNISINEEEPIQGGGSCMCPEHLYASSDSISSMDSFIVETIFSDKAFEDGDANIVVSSQRGEEAKEGRDISLETKSKQIREHSQVERGKQNKENLSCANEVRREQGISVAGAAFSEQEKVNTICSFLHKSLFDLALCVQNFNPSTTQPDLDVGQFSKAQINNSGLLGLMEQGVLGGMDEVCAREIGGTNVTGWWMFGIGNGGFY